jgi:hypothetical protein
VTEAAGGIGTRRDVRPVFWLGLPVASVAVRLLAPLLLDRESCERFLTNEFGFLELGTAALLAPAVVLSALLLRYRDRLPRGALVVLLAGGACALYFLGEEISWGQQLLALGGTVDIEALSREEQFALHTHDELGNVFNNLPRQTMLVLCIVGGVVLPIVLRRKLSRPGVEGSFWYWVIPTWRLAPAALLAVVSTVPEKVLDAWWPQAEGSYLDLGFVEAGGEFKEYCYAMVMLLYFMSVHARLRRRAAPA